MKKHSINVVLAFGVIVITVLVLFTLNTESSSVNLTELTPAIKAKTTIPSSPEIDIMEMQEIVEGDFVFTDYGDGLFLISGYKEQLESENNKTRQQDNTDEEKNIITPDIADIDELILPTTVQGNRVVGVKDNAFANIKIKALVIPEGYKYIGDRAFYDSGISKLQLPTTLTSIQRYAFANNKLINLNLAHLRDLTLGENSFENNRLYKVSLPESPVIPNAAFKGNLISELTIPHSVKVIKNGAFQNNQITQITFSKSSEDYSLTVESNAFRDNKLKSKITLHEGIHYESDTFDNDVYDSFEK